MPASDDPTTPISAEDAAALARFAALTMPADRLPRLAAELTIAQGLIRDLETVEVDDLAPAGAFNPARAWHEGGSAR